MSKIQMLKGTKERKTTGYLTFKLTRQETEQYGRNAADLEFQHAIKQSEFDGIKKHYKDELDELESSMRNILKTIRSGTESRHVEYIEQFDFEDNVVRYIHEGTVMVERPMQDNERQFQMNFEEKEIKANYEEMNVDTEKFMRNETSVINQMP